MAHTNQKSPRPLLGEEESLDRSRRMNRKRSKHGMSVALLMLAMPLLGLAQDDAPPPPEGKVMDGYVVQQSVEFGGRITSVDGNEQLYDTLVNLHSGPRLFGQELSMRPMTRGKGPFDTLYLSSFGFGGDPNDMARLRVEKGKWYNFVALYRRDQNYFDYNLFANPLNLNLGIGAALKVPANPAFPAGSALPWLFNPTTMPWYVNSPHLQDTTRNMGDFNLTLFPQSVVRIRLGYARNVTDGTLDTTLESPIQTIIGEHDRWRSDRYQFGIDFRVLRRTTISYDQFYEHDKVDPNFADNNLSFTDSVTGTPIDVGISFPARGCTPVAGVNFPGGNVYTPTAGCNVGLLGFNRFGQVRTDIPTEQLSLESNYFRNLDITGSGTYSSGHSDFRNYQETAVALTGTTLTTGNSHTDRVSGNADLGLTYHFNREWSVSDKFRWLDWRDPGVFNQTSSPLTTDQTYIAERTYSNTAKLNWAPSRLVSAYLGYHYGRRELTGSPGGDSLTLNSYYLVGAGVPEYTAKINEDTALGGVVLRPTDAWRINGDLELLSADNAFTYIGPRHQQRFRINTVYKVNRWASINGGVHFVETRNDFAENINGASTVFPPFSPLTPNLFPPGVPPAYGHKDHWRYYTFSASLNPNPHFGLDFGWTYLDQLINSATCVPVATASLVAQQIGPDPVFCVNSQNPTPSATTADLPLTLAYQERTNTGFAILTFRPIHRVTLNAGYEITSTAGYNRWLLPGGADGTGSLLALSDIYGNSPKLAGNLTSPCPSASIAVTGGCGFPGPFPDAPLSQALNWNKPSVGIAVDITKNLVFKGGYAYYDYNEKETRGLPVVTLPRDFHANTGTVSLKYSF